MRVVVTGIAVDKSGDEFEVMAQIIKPSVGSKTAGGGAQIDYVSDKGKTLSGAIAKMAFKAGKSSAFSHPWGLMNSEIIGFMTFMDEARIIQLTDRFHIQWIAFNTCIVDMPFCFLGS